jgi:uncharacterized protein (DUF1786 family)
VSFRTCIHTKANGTQCGSPAMRDELRCYFHYKQRKPFTRLAGLSTISNPTDRALVLDKIFRALINGRIDPEVARAMLYAIQISMQT